MTCGFRIQAQDCRNVGFGGGGSKFRISTLGVCKECSGANYLPSGFEQLK